MEEAAAAAGVVAAGDVEAAVEDAEVVVVKKNKTMKKIIIHSVPVVISFLELAATSHTFNPVILRAPEFLKFYLLLVFGFYASVLALKSFKETVSKTTLSFMILIFLLGLIKLVRGVLLGKPVGFLIMILIAEGFAEVLLIKYYLKKNIK
ncbi:hypothetical protein LF887_23875 [Chryseobacterium sp. MEBOG06]|uniref:hypothetical protein n=1 Tax=Chryseobacterium sp. MEBOG06 TaxID=2879938 RepID=UPI001F41D5AE|nr:hypothetical protein [Chryseobacterium sp. MEBOG06]UKB83999.1 hypothetical protein LF887_23875 [Chryseobacterium sp. MEBOG06]